MVFYWVFLGVYTLALSSVSGQFYDLLYSNLVNNAPSMVIPKPNDTSHMTLHIGLTVRRLRHLDPESLMVDLETWVSLKWSNPMLGWIPEAYNNIENISIALDTFWRPDVVLYDNPDDVTYSDVNAVVSSSGECQRHQPARIRTMCNKGGAGAVACQLQFGSWTYSKRDLDLQFDPVSGLDVSGFKENPKWQLAEHSNRREEIKEDCCPEIYVSVWYNFTFIPRG